VFNDEQITSTVVNLTLLEDPSATFSLDRKGGAKRSRLQRSGEKCPEQPKEKQVRAFVHYPAAV
jgi:hypothetical protein